MPRLECSGVISAHCSFDFLSLGDPPTSAAQVAGTTGMHHHVQLIFCIFSRDRFRHVSRLVLNSWAQTMPASVSQSARITRVSHCTQPTPILLHIVYGCLLLPIAELSNAMETLRPAKPNVLFIFTEKVCSLLIYIIIIPIYYSAH
uniref:Uncharacterized protein n=1 Tax=Macaca mulatta TaxID=9544 RepID=A0A5F7ZXU4_MACMU